MKKNGKKYRKIQKEKKLKKQNNLSNDIEQEVDGIKTVNLAISQIVTENPILYDSEDTKNKYLDLVEKYLKIGGWNKRKYVSSGMDAYKKIIFNSDEIKQENSIEFYKYYILFDMLHLLEYETSKIAYSKFDNIRKQHTIDFPDANQTIVKKIINSVKGEDRRLVNLMKQEALQKEAYYVELIRKNIRFRKQKPFQIMVTATMSAGKSTFINSLVGKYVCLSQNMACTSKIHSIMNKAFEDGYSTEYDHELIMTADKEELLNDNEQNLSDVILVATNFFGKLSNMRLIVNDSPGVNFSGDCEHQKIANQLLERHKYGLLIYVMNATQLGTNDDDEHLDYVKRTIGRKPVMFVVNKVDSFDPDEGDVEKIIDRQTAYLESKGFKHPIVCPVSARAGYLAKQSQHGSLTRCEERELYNYVDKFEKIKLEKYYNKKFPHIIIDDNPIEELQLQKTCGILYVEQLIKEYAKGEK